MEDIIQLASPVEAIVEHVEQRLSPSPKSKLSISSDESSDSQRLSDVPEMSDHAKSPDFAAKDQSKHRHKSKRKPKPRSEVRRPVEAKPIQPRVSEAYEMLINSPRYQYERAKEIREQRARSAPSASPRYYSNFDFSGHRDGEPPPVLSYMGSQIPSYYTVIFEG